jgi:hypothetical protein
VIQEYDQAIAEVEDDVPHGVIAELRSLGALGKAWTLTVVAFCAIRAVFAWPMLMSHGVNPWWFLALDVGTAPTYGIGQAMGVKILRNERRPMRDAFPWIGMVLVSFLAPYLYLLLSAGKLPGIVVIGIVVWMVVFGTLGAFRMAREVRMGAVTT